MNKSSHNFTRLHGYSSTFKYHVAAFLSVTAWGAAFIFTKILLKDGLTPVEIYVYRFILAYLCVLCICPKPFFSQSLSDEIKFLLIGMCGGSIYFIAENTAMKYTLVTNVSLIVTTAPLISTLFLGLLYKSERPSRGLIFGSVIAFLGVACVIFNSSFEIQVNPLGDMLALLAALCWAVYTILLKPINAVYSAWFITRKTFFYGVMTALPLLAVEPTMTGLDVLMKTEVWGNLVLLGLIPSLLAYVFWSESIKGLGVIVAGNYLYVSPIVTLVMSAIILDETVSWIGYTGCAMILLGLFISEKLKSNRKY